MYVNAHKTLNFIDGDYCVASSGKWFENRSPADGRIVSIVEEASAADVDRAVRAAKVALAGHHALRLADCVVEAALPVPA